jgi:uncharacterized 2Fe-2S/4Fe-4S cluster protein (DUF4445 family)
VTTANLDGQATSAGPVRVDLVFEPGTRRVRVPAGVSVFDAASWNGIAIDSTCGGHGTCKKCKIRITGGQVPASPLDARAFDAGTRSPADEHRNAVRQRFVEAAVATSNALEP